MEKVIHLDKQIKERLEDLDLRLPQISIPGGAYKSLQLRGNMGQVAIQFPIDSGIFKYQGIIGDSITTQQGCEAMQLSALNVLSQLFCYIPYKDLDGLLHLTAYYRSHEAWDEAPIIVDAASRLFVSVLGDKGLHSRAILGVDNLPRNFSVGLSVSFLVKK